jgi:hypothetical protein
VRKNSLCVHSLEDINLAPTKRASMNVGSAFSQQSRLAGRTCYDPEISALGKHGASSVAGNKCILALVYVLEQLTSS